MRLIAFTLQMAAVSRATVAFWFAMIVKNFKPAIQQSWVFSWESNSNYNNLKVYIKKLILSQPWRREHAYISSIWEAVAGGSGVQGHPGATGEPESITKFYKNKGPISLYQKKQPMGLSLFSCKSYVYRKVILVCKSI